MRLNSLRYAVLCLSVLLLVVFVKAKEPSAFELQSGATKKELKNIQATNKNLENIAIDYNTRIQSLEQAQDGLTSVVDGQALRIKTLMDSSKQQEIKIQTLQANIDFQNETIQQQATFIQELQQKLNQNSDLINELNIKINELTALTTKLNQDILAQLNSLNQAKDSSPNQATSTNTKTTQTNANKKISFTKDPTKKKEILDEARKLYKEKKLNDAKERYKWLAENNYKSASCWYMVGEIAYQQNNYQEAINAYKQSVSLDDKASYMPILLWHTAWAFRYSKDMDNYNKFLDSLVRLYPNTDQGKKARDLQNQNKGKQNE